MKLQLIFMTMKLYNFLIISALCFLGTQVSKAQTSTKAGLAEYLFSKNHKWGIVAGYTSMSVTNAPNSVSFELANTKGSAFGLTYNAAQIGNVNLSLNMLYTSHQFSFFSAIKAEDIEPDYDKVHAGTLGISGPYHELKISAIVEYNFAFSPTNKTFTGFVGIGPELSFQRRVYGTFSRMVYPKGYDFDPVGVVGTEDYNNFMNVGVNFTIGTNIQLGNAFLLRPFITYHYQPNTLATYRVRTYKLLTSPNTVSSHHVTGNYMLFGIKIIPGRGLF